MPRNAALVTFVFLASHASAQTPSPPAFEAASIKPNSSGSGHSGTSGTPGQLLITNRSFAKRQPAIEAMLQTLLAERFGLAVHRETREGPAYALIAAKGGPKLQQVNPGGTTLNVSGNKAGETIHAEGVTMAALAAELSHFVEAAVVDKTGISGVYNLDLKFSTDQGAADAADVAASPTIYTALQINWVSNCKPRGYRLN